MISPEGCAAILWKDASAAPGRGRAWLDARTLLRLGIVDGVVLEPDGGAEADHGAAADRLRTALETALPALPAGLPPTWWRTARPVPPVRRAWSTAEEILHDP